MPVEAPCAEPASDCPTCPSPCGPRGCSPKRVSRGESACPAPFGTDDQCYRNFYSDCTSDSLIRLTQRVPEFATVGTPYPIEIYVTAIKDCANIVVTETLPMDAVYVRSDPAPQMNGKELRWTFPALCEGDEVRICLWVTPEKEGCCTECATVCACAKLCAKTQCGQPIVCIRAEGPDCICEGSEACYTICVNNTGSAPAFDVVVVDTLPEGLVHDSGMRVLNYQLGALQPGECRTIPVKLCAMRRGKVTNTATVSYCGGGKCTAEVCSDIVSPCVNVCVSGADWAYLCKIVDYQITVTNPGDLILCNVTVTNTSPGGSTIVAAPDAEICCNVATWCIPELCPGETMTFTASVRSQVAGNLVNKVEVVSQSDCGCCQEQAEVVTTWKGIPAVHVCMVEGNDPICVGETTVYRVCVVNQGTAEDDNLKLVVRFSPELMPVSANGPTSACINGNEVIFEPMDKLMPKQAVEYLINVKGAQPGNARADATVTTDSLSAPVTDTETTHVY